MSVVDNKGSVVYYLAIALMTFKLIADLSTLIDYPGMVDNLIILVGITGFTVKIFSQNYRPAQFVGLFVVGGLCIYTCVTINNYYLLMSYFAIVALQDVPMHRCLKVMLFTSVALLLLHFLAYWIIYYFRPEMITLSYRDGRARHAFFFVHPNAFSMVVMWSVAEYLYLKFDRLRFRNAVILFAIIIVTYYLTMTRTVVILAAVTIIGTFVVKRTSGVVNWFVRAFAKYGFAFFSAFFIVVSVYFFSFDGMVKTVVTYLDKLISNRIVLGALADKLYGLTLLGQEIQYGAIKWDPIYRMNELALDIGYHKVAFELGLFYTGLFSTALFLSARKLPIKECFFIGVYLIFACSESYITNAILCFPLLFVAEAMYGNGERVQAANMVCAGREMRSHGTGIGDSQ